MLWTLATMLYQLRLSLLVVAEYEEVGGSDVTDIANGEDNRLANVNWLRRYRPSHHPPPPLRGITLKAVGEGGVLMSLAIKNTFFSVINTVAMMSHLSRPNPSTVQYSLVIVLSEILRENKCFSKLQ